ncbi:MAG: hypothetical protein AAF939_06965 [Planctomycetota bacterium]
MATKRRRKRRKKKPGSILGLLILEAIAVATFLFVANESRDYRQESLGPSVQENATVESGIFDRADQAGWETPPPENMWAIHRPVSNW